ncbi:hypothetical protein BpHYR1_047299 [Brachionus plicatilis]|uniref:Uncharacterized protein n=1 Tax=Brachionus plicatilis TaxID=10195 RepID=A0A3M7T0Y8_BRAPC|nr:hypothetical protein BpHYR1_047299 [Brachionus plicatilis]
MSGEEEKILELEINDYKNQIDQINTVLNSNESEGIDRAEFTSLKNDLELLLKLSEETLLDFKKQKLLAELDSVELSVHKNDQDNLVEFLKI